MSDRLVPGGQGRVCVLAPGPLLSVLIEPTEGGTADVHLHPGGQGVWVATLLCELGASVTLCATFGGETGRVLHGLLDDLPLVLRSVATAGSNAATVDDRTSGERRRIASMAATRLSRHEVDDLFGVVLIEAFEADVCVLGGPGGDGVVPSNMYRRLAADLVTNDTCVVADLSGADLDAAFAGGATVIKCSHEELLRDGRIADEDPGSLLEAMIELGANGQRLVVCSRAHLPALACFGGEVFEVRVPALEALDSAGAGDSFTAALAASLAAGSTLEKALRHGAAAGALNVTRHGLGTGSRREIERFAGHARIHRAGPGF